jgi:hypothetical protein
MSHLTYPTLTTGSPPPSLYGSITLTHLEEYSSMVKLPYLCEKARGGTITCKTTISKPRVKNRVSPILHTAWLDKHALTLKSARYCSHYLPLVSGTLVANLPPLSLIPDCHRRQISTGIVDTGGKFDTGVNKTSGTGGKICCQCR